MTPARFRAIRLRLGISQGQIAGLAGLGGGGQAVVSAYECGQAIRDERAADIHRALDECRRQPIERRRRARARARWASLTPASLSAMHYMRQAAAAADRGGLDLFADWLLAARPPYVVDVSTGTIVHCLMCGAPDPWDILIGAGIADFDQASRWFDDGAFEWGPDPAWLFA